MCLLNLSILFKPLGTVTYSKRKWSIAFDDSHRMYLLVPRLPSTLPHSNSTVTTRLVARSLFGDLSHDVLSSSSNGLSANAMAGGTVSQAMTASVSKAVESSGLEEISSPVVLEWIRRTGRRISVADGRYLLPWWTLR